ncbi:hypothetical protein FDP41_004004 [Naegleria fowleri]|uniref:Uncharacterized protein n=1 Tax=Naegleria fowleri TaxID=5763 RepID=A0A6A5BUW2_NAEFO|nr:uncharacterized protein FDP41_004004 [Naegleria fowleri]KAF0976709.1 hypothetical protein FDP41_004004 [Naegleria fowleri]CAG4714435.1 unnamed protein product [Naegleria fowleri]
MMMIRSMLWNFWNSLTTETNTTTTHSTESLSSSVTSKDNSSSTTTSPDQTYHVHDLLIPYPTFSDIFELDREEEIRSSIQFESLEHSVKGCFLLHHVLTRKECETLIEISEQMGYRPSPLSILSGNFDTSQYNERTKQVRDSGRVSTDMPQEVIRILNERIEKYLPQTIHLQSGELNRIIK